MLRKALKYNWNKNRGFSFDIVLFSKEFKGFLREREREMVIDKIMKV